MNRLYSIVRCAHSIGTHQCFAMDALVEVQTDAGERLSHWLLHYHADYLRGAIDPDRRFRDYHNHLIHARDGYWGGAPQVALQWYRRLQKYLRAERFRDAAHAAGVLSHYITDVINPLHTASTDRETLVHRPLECSVEQSYDRIYRQWKKDDLEVLIQLSGRPRWLEAMMVHSARFASAKFEPLVRRYRFDEGTRNPRTGLDDESIHMLSELFALAITLWARVLDRAAEEAERYTEFPIADVGFSLATPYALLTAPLNYWKRTVFDAKRAIAVKELAEEYYRTGKLSEHLPPEVDIKRRVIQVYRDERANQDRWSSTRAA